MADRIIVIKCRELKFKDRKGNADYKTHWYFESKADHDYIETNTVLTTGSYARKLSDKEDIYYICEKGTCKIKDLNNKYNIYPTSNIITILRSKGLNFNIIETADFCEMSGAFATYKLQIVNSVSEINTNNPLKEKLLNNSNISSDKDSESFKSICVE